MRRLLRVIPVRRPSSFISSRSASFIKPVTITVIRARAMSTQTFVYPQTKRVSQVDDFHGVKVEDPYRWLEDDVRTSKEVEEWVELQNQITFDFLENIPHRQSIKEKLTEMWNYEKYSAPWKAGDRYFFYKNDGLQNQSVLYTMDSLEGEPRVLIDPNTFSNDGTVALSGIAVSDDAKYIAYGISRSGSDWVEWKVRDIESSIDLPDSLKWVKYSGISWANDSKGFFYARFDAPKEGETFQALSKFQKLYYHRIRTPQEEDVLVYHRPDQPDWGFSTSVTEGGHYLIITIWKGTDPNYRVMYKDLWEPYGCPVDLIDNFDNEYSVIGNDGPVFYFKTKKDAPRGRVISIDIRKPDPSNWREIIPQSENTLEGIGLVGNVFIAQYFIHACSQIKIYSIDGKYLRDVALPGIGSADGFSGKRTDTMTFYTFSSYAVPPSIYSYDILTGESKLFRKSKAKIDPEEFITSQVFYNSKDGTCVPMFITHRKGLSLPSPTILYGYGGFNISLTPYFSISVAAWLKLGGVYAVACIRGGGEYGKEWHEGGKKHKKQNSFDDFIAAAEWLASQNYTHPKLLAISGGSNGGMLVGACLVQKPHLFGACLPAVGVMDMLRFHKFTAGKYWVDDYGCADVEDEFKVIHTYSPYHNVRSAHYPAVFITTADTDDRVVPGHSFKFTAALQAAQQGPSPVLIRIERKAGHGAGKPTSKIIEEATDKYAFLVKIMGMEPQL
jgi:prolyl oligopeptidase